LIHSELVDDKFVTDTVALAKGVLPASSRIVPLTFPDWAFAAKDPRIINDNNKVSLKTLSICLLKKGIV